MQRDTQLRGRIAWTVVGSAALLAALLSIAAFAPAPAAARPQARQDGPGQLAIDNFTYQPKSTTVPVGATVVWTNHDDVPHTVTASPDLPPERRFGSGALDTDDQFTHQFTEPGTYAYFCAIHPKMTGEIVVQ